LANHCGSHDLLKAGEARRSAPRDDAAPEVQVRLLLGECVSNGPLEFAAAFDELALFRVA
jgi:hypothetical protein